MSSATGLDESTHTVTLHVNGRIRSATVPARRLLSDFLRHDLGLTGTHVGCEHGVCGCCTVLLHGNAVRACLLLAVGVEGMEVTTIEGLAAADGGLHPIQQAFHDNHGLQCGFCTPGMVMSTCDFLANNPDPTHEEVREGISGNLCRCTGYQNIVKSVEAAAVVLRETGMDPRSRCPSSESGDAGAGALARADLGATPNVPGTSGRGPHGQGGPADDRDAAHVQTAHVVAERAVARAPVDASEPGGSAPEPSAPESSASESSASGSSASESSAPESSAAGPAEPEPPADASGATDDTEGQS